jgi:hypothetical protein
MVFAGGILLRGKETILAALADQPWQSFHLESPEVIALSSESGIVVYRMSAQREGQDPYAALVSSLYIRCKGDFKLLLHQQTPI